MRYRINLEENDDLCQYSRFQSQYIFFFQIHSLINVINLHRFRNYLLKRSNTSLKLGYQLEFSTLGVPVAVINSLHSLKAPPHFAYLIEGESLLNDGSATVVFLLCLNSVGLGPDYGVHQSNPNLHKLYLALKLSCLGVLVGVGIGLILVLSLAVIRNYLKNSEHLDTSCVFVAIFSSFAISTETYIDTSGVLAVSVSTERFETNF